MSLHQHLIMTAMTKRTRSTRSQQAISSYVIVYGLNMIVSANIKASVHHLLTTDNALFQKFDDSKMVDDDDDDDDDDDEFDEEDEDSDSDSDSDRYGWYVEPSLDLDSFSDDELDHVANRKKGETFESVPTEDMVCTPHARLLLRSECAWL